ncbi:MAG: tetratricopeptide repeat protein [Aquiluna sp.]|nr:tetratricopeptide repeat protein [Aquiluna sp.]MCF8545271.1 tetratricopeptide repeat protein [Aquiluna sp.]
MSNFGAFDLSSLNQKPQAGNQVAGFLVKADETILRQYLKLSESFPVLLLVTGQDPESATMQPLVQKAIESAQGRLAGVEIEAPTYPELAQALGVSQTPALLAILRGQPAPIFQGEVTKDQLLAALSQVLQLAVQNNLTGSIQVVTNPAEAMQKPLSPEHLAALQAIEAGDMELAKSRYEKLIVEYPNDDEAKAGLYQVQLMLRLSAPKETGELAELLSLADQVFVQGKAAEAFTLILDRFAIDFENREILKGRLLELFVLAGIGEQIVLDARRRLASMLF